MNNKNKNKKRNYNEPRPNPKARIFDNVPGFGPRKSAALIRMGFSVAQSIETRIDLLTQSQIAGLHYGNQLNELIDSSEIEKMEILLEVELKHVDPKYLFTICGDYRRGMNMCKSITVVMSYVGDNTVVNEYSEPPEKFNKIIKHLVEIGFIVDPLEGVGIKKFKGICQLDMNTSFHFIEIHYVQHSQYFCAVFLQTGSSAFIQKMKKRGKTFGISFEDNIVRKTACRGLVEGPPLRISCEKDIFEKLKMPYKTPFQRF